MEEKWIKGFKRENDKSMGVSSTRILFVITAAPSMHGFFIWIRQHFDCMCFTYNCLFIDDWFHDGNHVPIDQREVRFGDLIPETILDILGK